MEINGIVKKVSVEDTDHIVLDGLSDTEIERKKRHLVKIHISRATKKLTYSVAEDVLAMCSERLFWIQYENKLVLCGVYMVCDKRDPIGEHTSKRHEIYDYLLFCEEKGFYFVCGCSGPKFKGDTQKCVSPSIYHKSSHQINRQLLKYGDTYQVADFQETVTVHNVVTHTSYTEHSTDITILSDTDITKRILGASLFCDLPFSEGHILYTKEINHMGWFIPSVIMDCFSGECVDMLCRGGYSFTYNSESTLSCVMVDTDNSKLRTSDEDNYYFYISKSDTIAFDEIMKCVRKYGSMEHMENLFPEDNSVNYKLIFSKQAPADVISFVFGIISKSKVLYPVVFGCPIHDVVEVLCRDSLNNPYELPQHTIDEISAQNIIDYIKSRLKISSNGEIVHLLAYTYGSYAALTRHQKYWIYYHGENLRCEYLPTSLEDTVGKPINGQYVRNLEKSNLDVKWKSEYLLYRMIYAYFPDAVMHYSAPWLGLQHLDVFIPSLSLAIEYQGQQHYKSSDFFGGEMGFDDRQFLDDQKRLRCKNNNVTLLEWPYTSPVTPINMICYFAANGISDVPKPDPFRVPPETSESIPEERIAIRICQFTKSGEFVEGFSSYDDASKASGISASSIHKAASGYNRTAGEYQWRRILADQPVENIPPIEILKHTNKSIPIYQVSLEGEILAEFDSIGKAEKATGINRKSIRCVLNGVQKQAGGYIWLYKENI